jgi:hypothetical protein
MSPTGRKEWRETAAGPRNFPWFIDVAALVLGGEANYNLCGCCDCENLAWQGGERRQEQRRIAMLIERQASSSPSTARRHVRCIQAQMDGPRNSNQMCARDEQQSKIVPLLFMTCSDIRKTSSEALISKPGPSSSA